MITDERSIVGYVLNGRTWVLDEPLLDPRHQAIARAAAACQPVTVEAVAEVLQREGQLERVGGMAYLTELARIPQDNSQEAYERGYQDGRQAQAGQLVRVYAPEDLPVDLEDWDTGLDLETAYCDGWDRGAYDVVAALLAGYDPQVTTAVLKQFAYSHRPDMVSVAGHRRDLSIEDRGIGPEL